MTAHLEGAYDPLGLLLVGDVVAVTVAGSVVFGCPAELSDPDLAVAQAVVEHRRAHILNAPEVELAAGDPAGARAGIVGPQRIGRVALAAGVHADHVHVRTEAWIGEHLAVEGDVADRDVRLVRLGRGWWPRDRSEERRVGKECT